jgi:hypothetical protein
MAEGAANDSHLEPAHVLFIGRGVAAHSNRDAGFSVRNTELGCAVSRAALDRRFSGGPSFVVGVFM